MCNFLFNYICDFKVIYCEVKMSLSNNNLYVYFRPLKVQKRNQLTFNQCNFYANIFKFVVKNRIKNSKLNS